MSYVGDELIHDSQGRNPVSHIGGGMQKINSASLYC